MSSERACLGLSAVKDSKIPERLDDNQSQMLPSPTTEWDDVEAIWAAIQRHAAAALEP
jgi:hypothetical protein